ncbi:hypothetical protein CSKR_106343 [Clonorchis sinensis]|uniref:Uncharacterized protein n=1 Tax=Clonorchis sinensis TaxID=79923 RepID=A0A8T1LYD2_CLOSI|nr:hypothetical protein CSKR_106343 [Clonorchis sinensis]
MGDYDSRVDEELFKRILEIVHRDAPGELHNLLAKLAATNASKLITENTFFVAFAKRNLLHVATYNQARNCVRLLVNPPHCWDPDKLDGRNHNPMYLAEMRDDIGVLVEIARQSKERRDMCSPSVDKPIYGGFPSTALVWPQDLWVHPLKRDAMIGVRHVGISGSEHDPAGHYMFRTQMIGPLVALVFELYIANPSLFAFDFWTGEESDNKQRLFWPVPSNEPDLREEVLEHSSCEDYPHCLYRISVITRQLHLPDEERGKKFTVELCTTGTEFAATPSDRAIPNLSRYLGCPGLGTTFNRRRRCQHALWDTAVGETDSSGHWGNGHTDWSSVYPGSVVPVPLFSEPIFTLHSHSE